MQKMMAPLFYCGGPFKFGHPQNSLPPFPPPLFIVLFVVLCTAVAQLHCAVLLPSRESLANDEAGGSGTILLSRYGRAAAVLSRYGKRTDAGAAAREFEGGGGSGPWFLCQLSLDGHFLRCRSPMQRRKK